MFYDGRFYTIKIAVVNGFWFSKSDTFSRNNTSFDGCEIQCTGDQSKSNFHTAVSHG